MFWMDKRTLYSVEMAQMQGKKHNFLKKCGTLWEKSDGKNTRVFLHMCNSDATYLGSTFSVLEGCSQF